MKIFADSATLINDNQEPDVQGNYRYSDTSARYAAGFPYLAKLNSAMLNGILHRITSNIVPKQYISASKIRNFTITYSAKYCSDADITDPDAKNATDYVLPEQIDAFSPHALKKKKETVKALLTGETLDNTTYYDSSEAQKARSVAY